MKHDAVPLNLEVERAVLGGMLYSKEVAQQYAEVIKREWFYGELHQLIFGIIVDRLKNDEITNLEIMAVELTRFGKLEQCGGVVGITSLTDNAGLDVKYFSRALHRVYFARESTRLHQALLAAAIKDGADSAEVQKLLDETRQKIDELAALTPWDAPTMREALISALAELEKKNIRPVLSGVQALDRLTGGFHPGELVVICGESGVGKTLFAAQIGRTACSAGLHGLFVSCEMSAQSLMLREAAGRTGISLTRLRDHDVSDREFQELMYIITDFCDQCRLTDGGHNITEIERAATKLKIRGLLSWMIIDYDELVEAPGKDEWEQQAKLALAAKRLAMREGIPVILLSQLRKALNKDDREHPTLSRLYGSAAKVKHASAVIYVHREYVTNLHGSAAPAGIVVLKNRNGPLGPILAEFDVSKLRFRDKKQKEDDDDADD